MNEQQIKNAGYDAIDLGCAHGNTVQFARDAFGAKKILGIDQRGVHHKDAKRMGFDFLKADVLDDLLDDDCTKFVTMGHFLEHMPDLDSVDLVLMYALEAATEFVYAGNPTWDCVPRLKRHGLKYYWAEWADHLAHVTTKDIHRILSRRGIAHVIFASGHAANSTDLDMHSLKSPNGVAHYDAKQHPPKPMVTFVPSVFKEMTVFAWKDRQAWLKWRPKLNVLYGKHHRIMYEEIPE